MQLPAWVLQVPFANRNLGCGGKNQNDDRHPHIQERHTTQSYPAIPGVKGSTHP